MPQRFRIEHYSTLRGGEKVRSVRRGGHVVRIAFPGGRRVKGSGRVIEVLHPVNENPCRLPNPAELVVMMANPSGLPSERPLPGASLSRLESASESYRQFHGTPGEHIDEIHEPSPMPLTLSEIGDLIELRVKRGNGWKWGSFDFTGRGVRVAQNPEGTQIYFVDGNQKIGKGDMTACGADRSKMLIDLGEARYIAYRTRKAQVDNVLSTYEHFFGEETHVYPRLGYDRRAKQPRLFLSGGAYHVEARGIVN